MVCFGSLWSSLSLETVADICHMLPTIMTQFFIVIIPCIITCVVHRHVLLYPWNNLLTASIGLFTLTGWPWAEELGESWRETMSPCPAFFRVCLCCWPYWSLVQVHIGNEPHEAALSIQLACWDIFGKQGIEGAVIWHSSSSSEADSWLATGLSN